MARQQDYARDLDWTIVFGNAEHFRGTAGDDHLIGTGGRDKFHIEQGGNDTVEGGDGNDFVYAGASLNAADRIDGGEGRDTLTIDGDYSSGLALESRTISNIEKFDLEGGFDYAITLPSHMRDDNFFVVDGTQAGSVQLDGSSTHSGLGLLGSNGDDILMGGIGSTVFAPHLGHDVMTGGKASDDYTFFSIKDSSPSDGDLITNFDDNKDYINLINIDADPKTPGYQSFHLGATPEHVGDVTLSYDAGANVTSVNVFTHDRPDPDMVIQLTGDHTDLTTASFLGVFAIGPAASRLDHLAPVDAAAHHLPIA